MGINQYRRRFIAWIACVAILVASFAPSVSHALAAAGLIHSSFQPGLCSAAKRVAVQDDGNRHARHTHLQQSDSVGVMPDSGSGHSSHCPASGMHFEHCPFCFTHAGSFALPPSETLAPLAAAACTARMPHRFYQCATPIFIWEAAQPRAPPFLS
jgi:hypothetical protein